MATRTDVRPALAPGRAVWTTSPARSRWTAVLVPVLVGLLLGPVDLLLQRVLPDPFANLADSPALWALVAFAVGWSDRIRGRWWPAAAGTLTLLLGVEGYDASAVLALDQDASTLADPDALSWLVLAVAAGILFGTAGSWARSAHRWRGPLGTAGATAVLLSEAWLDLARSAAASTVDGGHRQDLVQTALVLVALAGVAAVVCGRSARQRVVGLALALPLALAGALAYGALGVV